MGYVSIHSPTAKVLIRNHAGKWEVKPVAKSKLRVCEAQYLVQQLTAQKIQDIVAAWKQDDVTFCQSLQEGRPIGDTQNDQEQEAETVEQQDTPGSGESSREKAERLQREAVEKKIRAYDGVKIFQGDEGDTSTAKVIDARLCNKYKRSHRRRMGTKIEMG